MNTVNKFEETGSITDIVRRDIRSGECIAVVVQSMQEDPKESTELQATQTKFPGHAISRMSHVN